MTTELDRTFTALADATRRKAIERLKSRPYPAGQLARALDVSPPVMSRHLRVLRTAGLVEEDHQGADARVRVYRLRQEPFGELRRWADEVERYWTRELEAFRAHIERKRRPAGRRR
ncbi:MAG: ArsR/SmtB family transcription factor [Thermoanaerobaculia bacterium]